MRRRESEEKGERGKSGVRRILEDHGGKASKAEYGRPSLLRTQQEGKSALQDINVRLVSPGIFESESAIMTCFTRRLQSGPMPRLMRRWKVIFCS